MCIICFFFFLLFSGLGYKPVRFHRFLSLPSFPGPANDSPVPRIYIFNTSLVYLPFSILSMCSFHLCLFSSLVPITELVSNTSLISSFVILSSLVHCFTLLRNRISDTSVLLESHFESTHVCET